MQTLEKEHVWLSEHYLLFSYSSLKDKRISCLQSPTCGFLTWKWVKFNNLLMESDWDLHISEIESYRALKMEIPREQFVENQNLKGY